MSLSVPSGSSSADVAFAIGVDLVVFDRRTLPIYTTPESHWGEAGREILRHGAPLDRLYEEDDDEVFIASQAGTEDAPCIAAALSVTSDRLVIAPGLSDVLILPTCEYGLTLDTSGRTAAHDMTTIYDFGAGSPLALPLHDGWSWEQAKPDWFYDHHI